MRMQGISTVVSLAAAAALVACGATATPAASPIATPLPVPTTAPTPAPTVAATPYPPKAAGFASTVLIERKRNIGASAAWYVRIAPVGASDAGAVTATVSEAEAYGASYRTAAERNRAPLGTFYESPDQPPLAVGIYTEGLRLVVVQPEGRSAAHKHAGVEVVVVLDGTVLIRTSAAPVTLQRGQVFLWNQPGAPIQLINIGGTVARTLVYSITTEGLPFSTELDASP